jgi:hypothetical protein
MVSVVIRLSIRCKLGLVWIPGTHPQTHSYMHIGTYNQSGLGQKPLNNDEK